MAHGRQEIAFGVRCGLRFIARPDQFGLDEFILGDVLDHPEQPGQRVGVVIFGEGDEADMAQFIGEDEPSAMLGRFPPAAGGEQRAQECAAVGGVNPREDGGRTERLVAR